MNASGLGIQFSGFSSPPANKINTYTFTLLFKSSVASKFLTKKIYYSNKCCSFLSSNGLKVTTGVEEIIQCKVRQGFYWRKGDGAFNYSNESMRKAILANNFWDLWSKRIKEDNLCWTHSIQMRGWCPFKPLKLFSNKSSRAVGRSLWLFPEKKHTHIYINITIWNIYIHKYYELCC